MSEAALRLAGAGRAADAPDALPEYYIEAQTSLVERALRTLKDGDAFAVLDAYGDIGALPDGPEGLYFHDTRFLSHFELRLEGRRPLLLSSIIQDDNAALSVDLSNPDIEVHGRNELPRDIIFVERTKFLWRGAAYERIGLRNFDTSTRRFRIDLLYDADFRDLFEIRGEQRPRRGTLNARVVAPDRADFQYVGLDGITRRTQLRFEPRPARIDVNRASFDIVLEPAERCSLRVTVVFDDGAAVEPTNFALAYRDARRATRAVSRGIATIESSNELFNEVCCRATSDLYTLVTETENGLYPYAGIPWYSTVFGRDGIITAMLTLWMDPSIARGVLRHLAATQATHSDPKADAQPGKILHERRHGEMAILGEVPFRFYFGSVDATPLFVMLAGQYFERTGDLETIRAIWPNIRAALRWIDDYGDLDGDGFVEYSRETEKGLANQGWKDSYDAIFHADGAGAEGPIALCEVQGYVFAAKRAGAKLAFHLGEQDLAAGLVAASETLWERFDAAFWCEEIGTYALALDGDKRPCRVRASNAGHALFTGIARHDRARRIADTLLSPDGFSGWGIRTIARGEARYNPMSYHNGSIWPHDNALIALGLARYELKAEAARVFGSMFAATTYQDLRRLPELFCGFIRRRHRGPTSYPVACAPQAWASAAPFAFLGACLGLELPHGQNEVRFTNPTMPDFLDEVVLRNLRLGASRLDVRLHRHGHDVTVNVLSREGDARVVLLK